MARAEREDNVRNGTCKTGPARSGGRLGKGCTFSGSSDFLGETGNDTAGCVVLVQSMGQLLAGCLQLLAQSEAVQHDRILGKENAMVRPWGDPGAPSRRVSPT